MKPILPRTRLGVAAFLLMTGLAQAQSHDAGTEDLITDQMSVRELMRLDTALAVSQARSRLRNQTREGQTPDPQAVLAQSGPLKLVAIYGVGKKLLAQVMIGSHSQVYMRGRAMPVGHDNASSAYLLKGITGSCVQLERKEESHTLCLHPSLWTSK